MFSPVHAHLLLNHVPIIFTALGLLFILFAVLRHRDDIARLALGFFAGGAVFALPTYLTGEPAEDAVETLPGVTKTFIHAHEDAALYAAIIVGVLGLFALWILWRYRRPVVLPRWVLYVTLLGGLFGATAMVRTGLLGGEIRHTEIRSETSVLPGTDDVRPDSN